MARASRRNARRGRASVTGSRSPADRPRAHLGVGSVTPIPSAAYAPAFRRNAGRAVYGLERRARFALSPLSLLKRGFQIGLLQRRRRAEPDRLRKRALLSKEPFRRMMFDVPRSVAVCVKRKQRKEVLFAYRKAGYAGSGRGRWNGLRRSYRRTTESQYSC